MGKPYEEFDIERRVWQGCPLASYLFLIVGEALNAMIKKEQQEGRILGIKLPRLKERQLIAQYADDTNFTIKASRDATRRLVQVLEDFCHVFGLELNNAKTNGILDR
jgi:hypothetical protein